MRYLLDTHLLLWSLYQPRRLPRRFLSTLEPRHTEACFRAASVLEIAIKKRLNKLEFDVDLNAMRDDLLENGIAELSVESRHAFTLVTLPLLYRDPFDRLLVAQAAADGLVSLTVDRRLAEYGSMVELLR